MNKEILLKILKLDSLINCLEWEDRIKLHLFLNNKINDLPTHIMFLYEWMKISKWSAPIIQYGHDRLQYFYVYDLQEWKPVEIYLTESDVRYNLILLKSQVWKHRAQQN